VNQTPNHGLTNEIEGPTLEIDPNRPILLKRTLFDVLIGAHEKTKALNY
jgi:hypothetical protein